MYIILYNPLSRSSKKIYKLEKMLKRKNKEYEKYSVLEKLDVESFVKDYKDKIIIVGGDGTLNVIFNYVRNVEIKNQIFLYRAGTGNDFARSFKGKLIDITNSVKKLPHMTVDNQDKNLLFLNGCGIGIDGLVCKNVNSSNKKSKFHFFVTAIKAFFHFKRFNLKVQMDGKTLNFENVWFCSVMNGKYQGGGMKMSPKSNRNDEILEVLVVHNLSLFKILFLFPMIYLGWHTRVKKYIFYKSAKHIHIKVATPAICQLDGEVLDKITEVEINF